MQVSTYLSFNKNHCGLSQLSNLIKLLHFLFH